MAQTTIEFFESIGAFQAALNALPGNDSDSQHDFYGGSFNKAKRDLLKGNLPAAAKADALMNKLADDSMDSSGLRLDCSVAGFAPNVPAYLSGDPECMYAYDEVKSDTSPIRVFAGIGASAGLSQDDIEKRGVTILALCQKLAMIRPLELYVYGDMGDSKSAQIPVVKIETTPLDLSTATYALSHRGFLRRLCFEWSKSKGWCTGQWAWNMAPYQPEAMAKTRAALGMADGDLHIPGAYLTDPLVKKPVEWINVQIAKYAGMEVAA